MCTQLIHRTCRLDELTIHLQIERHTLINKPELITFGLVKVLVDRKWVVWQRLVIARELIQSTSTEVRQCLGEKIRHTIDECVSDG